MAKTTTKTNTQTKYLKNPTYAIFFKSWWITHSKYDDRYLALVILFTQVTLVTLFQSYNEFYRAECITVSGFFPSGNLDFKYFRLTCRYLNVCCATSIGFAWLLTKYLPSQSWCWYFLWQTGGKYLDGNASAFLFTTYHQSYQGGPSNLFIWPW